MERMILLSQKVEVQEAVEACNLEKSGGKWPEASKKILRNSHRITGKRGREKKK